MTVAILIAISAMWTSVAIFFLGKGEPKGTGAICAFVGATTIVGAIIQAAVFKDPFVAGLLFVHGIFYCSVALCLVDGAGGLEIRGECKFQHGPGICHLYDNLLHGRPGAGRRQTVGREE